MSSTSEILKSLSSLEENLNEINSAKEQVEKVINSSEELVQAFSAYQSSFEGLSSNVRDILKDSKSFNLDTLQNLSEQTKELKAEITRLTSYNFTTTFQEISNEAIKSFEKDLILKLKYIDNKVIDLQTKIDEFKTQITRLESIDLEKHFVKQQKVLSDILDTTKVVKQITEKTLSAIENNQKETTKTLANLEKEIKTNRTIQIIGFSVLVVLIIALRLL